MLMTALYSALRVFPVSLDKVEYAIAVDVSGNGQRNVKTGVTDNGWTRHNSRNKHDERYKKDNEKHDWRLEGKVDLSLEIGSWQTLLL